MIIQNNDTMVVVKRVSFLNERTNERTNEVTNERRSNDDRARGFEARRRRPIVVDGIRRSVSRSRRQRGELGGLDARRRKRRRRRAKKKHAEKTRRVLRVAMAPRRAGKGGRRAVARQETTRYPRPGSAPIESRAGRDHRRPGRRVFILTPTRFRSAYDVVAKKKK